ncbi:DUF4242 domain-containing protein [Bacillus aquiflavi]|uniref:DUF4242 domain-containing protein n=1 Tax=Bacillus aquiflavi TaxID=2672567 RepID=A0A6B3W3J1_9BACI|nr:DUF4242 domain-containing protein [Bacillus aquiflavi]MBA4538183.1 DUF4242 domain-containing protein [Bacillus aquiflavi]NEY82503.1 DUF4242 domain-containing protein [Bacillus aquiflavi]UAC48090.1 DUF4242 domain-containing protein [Bacillus aquiflavi]
MVLYLVESLFNGTVTGKNELEKKVADIHERLQQKEITLIEVQVSKDFSRGFFIFESKGKDDISNSLRELSIPVSFIKPVRLIGQNIEDVKNKGGKVNYVVEWNLPEDITMDEYLKRKEKNSVHYAEVPEVTFSRTYVCEDLTKCLCFYDAPNESLVKKAREYVKAPIDTITEISPKE